MDFICFPYSVEPSRLQNTNPANLLPSSTKQGTYTSDQEEREDYTTTTNNTTTTATATITTASCSC
ncbi:hypothetical protein E2C01_057473 [Portunus trituberculatus]|uniref:Uncharacterized protein n=1 Tax=Portunus trituberculatus TaxID=210409 RepID=A0A5B7H157_PORTR|nr:hypothetical protein [Portunus trituberculatus]